MVKFRLIPKLYILRPLAYAFRWFISKPITQPDGDRRNKDTIYFPEALADKGETILDKDLTLTDVFQHTPHISPNARGLIGLNTLNCIGCQQCYRICPNRCIEMKEVDPPPPHWVEKQKGKEKPKPLLHPEIFIGRCSYCGFCVESCRFDALFHTAGFDAATHHKEDLHYTYNDLYRIYQLYYPNEYQRSIAEYEKKYRSEKVEEAE